MGSTGGERERLVVGLVRGVHGLRGDVRVEVLTDHAERRFAAGSVLHREGSPEPLTIVSANEIVDGPGWRVRFREFADRNAAETLRGVYIEAAVEPGDGLAEGTVYWHELIGVLVTSPAGTVLGNVHDVYQIGGTEAIVVRGGPAGEFDVPLIRELVLEFEPRAGRIVVDAAILDLTIVDPDAPRPERPRGPRRRQGSRRGSGPPTDEPPAEPPAEHA